MVVPLITRHWRTTPCGFRRHTSCCSERSVVDPLASYWETWLEQHFRATEAFAANNDDASVWELVGLLDDVLNDLPLRGGSERVPSVSEDLHEILCEITAGQTKDGVMQSVTVTDGHCVRHVRASRSVQGSLGRHVHGGHVERLKPGLRHALSVSLGGLWAKRDALQAQL